MYQFHHPGVKEFNDLQRFDFQPHFLWRICVATLKGDFHAGQVRRATNRSNGKHKIETQTVRKLQLPVSSHTFPQKQ